VNQIYPVSLGISPSISVIAGFVKPGESFEEVLEAKEETGIMVQASTLEANRGLFPILSWSCLEPHTERERAPLMIARTKKAVGLQFITCLPSRKDRHRPQINRLVG
jgi:hypothetical protein